MPGDRSVNSSPLHCNMPEHARRHRPILTREQQASAMLSNFNSKVTKISQFSRFWRAVAQLNRTPQEAAGPILLFMAYGPGKTCRR